MGGHVGCVLGERLKRVVWGMFMEGLQRVPCGVRP